MSRSALPWARDLPEGSTRSPTPRAAAVFAVLVLLLSATQLLEPALERAGLAPPPWLEGLAILLGGGFSTVWAVLLVGGFTLGRSALRRLLRESLRVRMDGRLYLAALIAPLIITGLAAGLATAATGTLPALAVGTRPLPLEGDLWVWLATLLVLAPIFALSESLGWRAWLQRGLQNRISPLLAGVLVAVVWGLWHLPLFETDPLFSQLPLGGFLLATVTRSVLLAALFNAAGGSVVPVALAHVSFNLALQLSLPADLGDSTPVYLATAAVSAAAVVLAARWSRARATEGRPALL